MYPPPRIRTFESTPDEPGVNKIYANVVEGEGSPAISLPVSPPATFNFHLFLRQLRSIKPSFSTVIIDSSGFLSNMAIIHLPM